MISETQFYKEENFKVVEADGFKLEIPEDWEVVRLGDVCEFKRGFSYRSDQITEKITDFRFITINDFEKEGGLKRDAEKLYIRENVKVDPDFFLADGDVLIANTDMSRGFIIGAPILIENLSENLVYSMDLTKLIFDKNRIDSKFLFYWLTYGPVRQKMKTFAQGTNVLHLNHDLTKNLIIPLPPLPEQQKIAHVLMSIDKAIEAVDEAIKQAERIKKGLMQELLTKGIGHKEFKDTEIGRIPKEWEVVRLGDVAENFISGGTPSTKNPEYWDGDIPWIRSVHINGLLVDELSVEQFITKAGLENSASKVVPRGNVIIATRVGIGKAAVNLIDVAINQDLTGVVLKKERVDPSFLVWFLNLPKIVKYLESTARGTTIKGITKKTLEELKIPLPPLQEQQKIAEILSKWDEVIELKKAKKERLERMKKKAMDLLLTGKIRMK